MVWTLTVLSLIGYIAGLVILVKVTPALVKRSYDEALFIVIAAAAIAGIMLAFSAVGVTYSVFSGSLVVRSLDALLLLILFIVVIRTSLSAFRPRYGIGIGTYSLSRIMVGSFFLIVALAALCLLVLLFVPAS